MAVVESLYRLELLDNEIEQLRSELTDVQRHHAHNPELEAAEARLRIAEARDITAMGEQRSLETDLSGFEVKIKRTHGRLYGGQIVDSRELASLERELEHQRSEREALEERVLSSMQDAEDARATFEGERRRVEELRARWETERPDLAVQEGEIAGIISVRQKDRETLAASIDPRYLAQYTRLRNGLGHAVSAVTNGVCQMCRVGIPVKDVQHARSGDLVACTNCGRLLYTGVDVR